jgi:hypothetical protein
MTDDAQKDPAADEIGDEESEAIAEADLEELRDPIPSQSKSRTPEAISMSRDWYVGWIAETLLFRPLGCPRT